MQDECSFVSLRDIQRLLDVADWFHRQGNQLFPAMDEFHRSKSVQALLGQNDSDSDGVEEASALKVYKIHVYMNIKQCIFPGVLSSIYLSWICIIKFLNKTATKQSCLCLTQLILKTKT